MSDHPYMDAFFSALEEWSEVTKEWAIVKLPDLVPFISIQIGGPFDRPDMAPEEYLQAFKNRITYLLDNEHFLEDFLLTSLTRAVEEHLRHYLEHHGQAIVNNERMAEKAEKEYGHIELLSEKLHELKDANYWLHALWTLDAWEKIVVQRLGRAEREDWENENGLKIAKQLTAKPEVMQALGNITYGQLRRHLGNRSWTDLTVEEARELRRKFDSEQGESE